MKKIINKPEDIVLQMCHGIELAHPHIEFMKKYKILKKRDINKSKVTLISGGGSGHEPAHGGFVGKGMLDAAVCGDVFASPSQIQVYSAIKETASDKGTLLIIKNYSGDMMNFKNAAAMAAEDGIAVDYVKVDDDIAVQDSLYTVGRRGVAGTVLVHKIAGAAAERGMELSDVKAVAEKAIANVRSIGFALSSCTVPAKGSPTFRLDENQLEYGVGIHGEPGIRREALSDAKTLADRMTDSICEELGIKELQSPRAAVLINGFGSTPLMELYLLNTEVIRRLSELGVTITRSFVGNFMTSIDMAGASVSVMLLDDELEDLLNAPCDAPAFRVDGPVKPCVFTAFSSSAPENAVDTGKSLREHRFIGERLTLSNMLYIVDIMSASIIRNEIPFCELDSHAGDGDFGMSIAKGFKQLRVEWDEIIAQENLNPGQFLQDCSLVIMEHCGGASGPIWGSAFRAAGRAISEKGSLSVSDFAGMLQAAVKGIQATGERSFGRGAVVGDKTLIDALVPCADSWSESAKKGLGFYEAFQAGAAAAVEGAKSTESIVARMGRAGTVGERSLGYPDAGAHGLGVIFTDIAESIYPIER